MQEFSVVGEDTHIFERRVVISQCQDLFLVGSQCNRTPIGSNRYEHMAEFYFAEVFVQPIELVNFEVRIFTLDPMIIVILHYVCLQQINILSLNIFLIFWNMAYFQSETMVYCEAIMPRELSWYIMDRLGQMNCIHIVKPTLERAVFETPFGLNLKRCEETLMRINHIKMFLEEFSERKLIECSDSKLIFKEFEKQFETRNLLGHLYINEVQEEVNKIEKFLIQQKKEFDNIRESKKKMILNISLLLTLSISINLDAFYKEKNLQVEYNNNQLHEDSDIRRKSSSKLQYKCGLINRRDQLLLKRIVFRISHGNAWVQTYEVPYEQVVEMFKSQHQVLFVKQKLAFVIIFQSGEHSIIEQKINKVLASFDCYVDPRKPNPNNLAQLLDQFKVRLAEHNHLEQITKDCIHTYVDHMYEPKRGSKYSYLNYLELYIKKEKIIYKSLSQCSTSSQNFISFNAFIPVNRLDELRSIKTNRADLPSLVLSPKEPEKSPPTLFSSFELLQIPQQIVNTYGVPSYKEFNPAILYIVTFGFFVGVMFGDVGHMLLGVAVMVYLKPNKWWWTVVFWMGFCGVLYNQFFGLNLGLFDSCYNVTSLGKVVLKYDDCVYPIGIDPVWKVAQNRMQFLNGYKMKLAVILGVVHMCLGICIRGLNSYRKQSIADILTVVIPQFIFMAVTFLYMDFLIVIKWLTVWEDTSQAPSIINIMIGMVVSSNVPIPLVFYGEPGFETFLLTVAILMIPILLLGKPAYLYFSGKLDNQPIGSPRTSDNQFLVQEFNQKTSSHNNKDPLARELEKQKSEVGIEHDIQKQEYHSFNEIMIHQLIETIEFVLGAVSNTASYLRLWALSLAHTQLAEVFFDLMLENSLIQGYSAIVKLTLAFAFFLVITFGVLVCMDVMECFLHSLRLHWVEFQNKFFSGSGYAFCPFSFNRDLFSS